ncbi:EmrA/EmrK family multidrug efflux transporter periplasmic adaptor subunit [Bordetella sp. 15P40C-2]|uniref:EmrA/EmrK family multidrug efflux transporter periplasmic adaptor subunit n=1 Tax=Bordetella sp. 15P40C-2 TaxID=2572246 RepID=UPI00132B04F7|nr:EmrA/EmrK family multidrug efflux transporter periplasmic adaptor subunit [Bordetella sp. 15P40C-2]MVW70776.1 EmrA/EmrK family multidrug efflux transporter periplasmic adaptor subunit [Bordetella sp. 15P40C-2]
MTATSEHHPARKRLLLIAAGVFIVLAVLYGIWWALFGSHVESTDDAYVHGNLVQITPQVPGTVIAIEAGDTEHVQAGQAVIRLDPADAEVTLRQAEAQLAQTVRQVRTLYVQNESLEADIHVQQANIDRAQADLKRAQSDLQRRQTLAKTGGVSGEELLHAQTAVKTAQSGLEQARASLAAAQARLTTNQALTNGTTVATHPDVLLAGSRLREAWLAHARTVIPAPVDGVIARRSVQVGQRVAPGATLMSVVPLDQVWVEANFKEGQLRHMRPGQRVTLVSDLYGSDVTYHGKIVGLDAGTGSAFSLLPAQNATGNWIKVVQRVPVRIELDPKELQAHPLRVGLSMEVEVDLSQAVDENAPATPRHEPAWSTKVYADTHDGADALIDRIIQANL